MISFKPLSRMLPVSAAIALIATSCSSGKSTGAADSDSAAVDEEAVAETFTSPDLSWKELTGDVDNAVITRVYEGENPGTAIDSIAFTPDGKIKAIYSYYLDEGKRVLTEGVDFAYNADGGNIPATVKGDSRQQIEVKRDEQGRIVAFTRRHIQMIDSDDSYEETYEWNEQGQLHSSELSGWETQSSTVNHYGAEGELVKSVTTVAEPGYEATVTTTYEYKGRDDRGNWTERVITDKTVASEEGDKTEQTIKRTERRSIRYRS